MKPAPGIYRLSTPGAPSMDFVVNADGTAKCLLDDLVYVPADDFFAAQRIHLAVRCTGLGTFLAYVGVQPGFTVTGTCVKTA